MPSETLLSDVLSEFARTMLTEFPIQAILDQLVLRIVDVLPVTAAGVTLISPDLAPRYIAASSDAALRFEKLQTELREGPCLLAYRTGQAVVSSDLRYELRFPTFASRAGEAGLTAVFTFPLRDADIQLGALDLYRDSPGPLDAPTMAAAQTLADVVAAYLINAQARADLKDSSDRAREVSLHDPLTGLPNRVLLLDRLNHCLLRSSRSGRKAAVLFVDLDDFKRVNDIYGHRVGDELLVAVAQRFTGQVRPGDTLARLSGDEFVILCEDLGSRQEAEAIAARICACLTVPFVLSDTELTITASIGIAFAGPAAATPEDLLHDADLAMYQAKRRGGARYRAIELGEQHMLQRRGSLQRDLGRARAEGELQLEYQPIVDAADGRICGVEALLRWAHPSRGLVPPTMLVPLAEQSGDITDIGRWVLEQACQDRRTWRTPGGTHDLSISVNVSTHQVMSPDFARTVEAVLDMTGTDPQRLTLEVTESVFLRDGERAMVVLRDLKSLGVMVALDDFGTGFSSLSFLKRFPVDIVKIDKGSVADLGHDAASHAIVAAVVQLFHALALTVVAEGVETKGQRDAVVALGCDAGQGYYFARPLPADQIRELMIRGAGGNPRLPVDPSPQAAPAAGQTPVRVADGDATEPARCAVADPPR
ncbi:MAG: EAL domain-containing protein [Pseudonocardiales bacterium]